MLVAAQVSRSIMYLYAKCPESDQSTAGVSALPGSKELTAGAIVHLTSFISPLKARKDEANSG